MFKWLKIKYIKLHATPHCNNKDLQSAFRSATIVNEEKAYLTVLNTFIHLGIFRSVQSTSSWWANKYTPTTARLMRIVIRQSKLRLNKKYILIPQFEEDEASNYVESDTYKGLYSLCDGNLILNAMGAKKQLELTDELQAISQDKA